MNERRAGRRYNAYEAQEALRKAQEGWTGEATIQHLRRSGAPRKERRAIITIVRHQIALRKEDLARLYRKGPTRSLGT